MAAELGLLFLATQVAGLWLTAASLDGLFQSSTQAGYAARLLAGYLVVGLLDAAFASLRLAGLPHLVAPAMGLAMAGGAAAFWIVSLRLDREFLIQRF
jgi:uncharacterized membrane protein